MIVLTPEQRRTVEQQFRELADRWSALTHFRSNMATLRRQHLYHDITGLGEPAVPLILRELERRPSVSWFGILNEITGEDPVPAESAGHVAAMADSWLEWGRRRGYLE